MSGVLFVVYIPSKEIENDIREKHAALHIENEEIKPRDDIKEHPSTPISTPEMQRSFFKEPDDDYDSLKGTLDGLTLGSDADSLGSETRSNIVRSHTTDKLSAKMETLSKKSRSCDKINLMVPQEDKNMLRKSWDGLKDVLSSARKRKNHDNSEEKSLNKNSNNDLNLPEDAFMVDIMNGIIKLKNIRRVTWLPTQNNEGNQILFNIENGSRCEDTIRLLSEWGVGEREGTSVSVLPCTLYHEPIHDPLEEKPMPVKQLEAKDSVWGRFLDSMRARMNVAQIAQEVRANATITFDFLCLIGVACILAAFGLIEDSTVFLSASMLISPLMGPIIAATFGTVIKDRSLQWLGVRNELIGLSVATTIGFVFGMTICSLDHRYGVGEGLTTEILSRCELHSLIVGVIIALASGAAVAIAVLGENTGSLIGTAISASILPPAVNAGLLWALSLVYIIFEKDSSRYKSYIRTNLYSDHQSVELAIHGCISFCLTIVNIICIFVAGIIFLKIKEVSPIASRGQRHFWRHDIKIARDYNKSVHPGEHGSSDIPDELKTIHMQEEEIIHGVGAELLRNPILTNQHTWSPHLLHDHHHHHHHVRDSDGIYLSLAYPSSVTSNDSRLANLFHHYHHHHDHRKHSKPSPRYKSVPDEEMFTPSERHRYHYGFHSKKVSDPIGTPSGPPNENKPPSNSYPFSSRFLKSHSNNNNNNNGSSNVMGCQKRFTVSPVEDPIQSKK